MALSCGGAWLLRGKLAVERDAEIDPEIGLEIIVRLATAGRTYGDGIQRSLVAGRRIGGRLELAGSGLSAESGEKCIPGRSRGVACRIDRPRLVAMRRKLGLSEA